MSHMLMAYLLAFATLSPVSAYAASAEQNPSPGALETKYDDRSDGQPDEATSDDDDDEQEQKTAPVESKKNTSVVVAPRKPVPPPAPRLPPVARLPPVIPSPVAPPPAVPETVQVPLRIKVLCGGIFVALAYATYVKFTAPARRRP